MSGKKGGENTSAAAQRGRWSNTSAGLLRSHWRGAQARLGVGDVVLSCLSTSLPIGKTTSYRREFGHVCCLIDTLLSGYCAPTVLRVRWHIRGSQVWWPGPTRPSRKRGTTAEVAGGLNGQAFKLQKVVNHAIRGCQGIGRIGLPQPVESDAGVFTSLVEQLGVKGVQFEELLSLDPSEFSALQPLYGVIFLFKYPTDGAYSTPTGPLDGSFDHNASEHIFFAKQTIPNACATQALLSVLMNKTDRIDIGTDMKNFREFTIELPAEFRGEALSNSDLIRDVHNGFARNNPFVDETHKGGEAEDAFHFIAYTHINGTLYELDGLQPAPISHGPSGAESFPAQVIEVLKKRIERYDSTEIRFNLLAMCRDLRIRACEFGDDELRDREERKRRDWLFENALRRHNFLGFAGQVLQGVVRAKLSEGGAAGVSNWVEEGLEQRKMTEQAASRRRRGPGEENDMDVDHDGR